MAEEVSPVDAGQQAFKFVESIPTMEDVIVNGLSYQSMASLIENPSKGASESRFKNDTSSSSASFFSTYPANSSSSSSPSSEAFSSPESSICSGSPYSIVTSASFNSASKPTSKCNVNNDKIKVLVRMRPFREEEKVCPSRQVVCVLGNKILVKEHVSFQRGQHSSCRSFNQMELEADYVQDDSYVQADKLDKKEDAQRQTFDTIGAPAVEKVIRGQNVTILSYGQSGTGKSYTIYGDGTREGNGLLPRIASELLQQVEQRYLDKEFRLEVSFLEIYHEKLRDLLVSAHAKDFLGGLDRIPYPDSSTENYDYVRSETMMVSCTNGNKVRMKTSHQPTAFCIGAPSKPSEDYLKIREHPVMGTYVEGIVWKKVSSLLEMDHLFRYGMTNRTTISSDLNGYSSRSHTCFTMRITRFTGLGPSGSAVSYLNLVDLAGSEKLQNVSIERQNEMMYINKSLSQLNSAILSLSKGKFVSFRNSALTWLLKDSLGGNISTILVANVSPAEKDFSETLSTLKYALKAKQIQSSYCQRKDLR